MAYPLVKIIINNDGSTNIERRRDSREEFSVSSIRLEDLQKALVSSGPPPFSTGILPVGSEGLLFVAQSPEKRVAGYFFESKTHKIKWWVDRNSSQPDELELTFPDLLLIRSLNIDAARTTDDGTLHVLGHRPIGSLVKIATHGGSGLLGNVYSDNRVCWAPSHRDFLSQYSSISNFLMPLQQLMHSYFETPFNNDLGQHSVLQGYSRTGILPNCSFVPLEEFLFLTYGVSL